MSWFKKKEEKHLLIIEDNANKFLESYQTLLEFLKSYHREWLKMGKARFDYNVVQEYVRYFSARKVLQNYDFDNFDWIRHFGRFILIVSEEFLLENSSDNYVFAEYHDGVYIVYFHFQNSVAKIKFGYLAMSKKDNMLESFIETGDMKREKDWIDIDIKRDLGEEVICHLSFEDTKDCLKRQSELHHIIDVFSSNARSCIINMYDYIVKYIITTYFGVIADEDETWEDILYAGL